MELYEICKTYKDPCFIILIISLPNVRKGFEKRKEGKILFLSLNLV